MISVEKAYVTKDKLNIVFKNDNNALTPWGEKVSIKIENIVSGEGVSLIADTVSGGIHSLPSVGSKLKDMHVVALASSGSHVDFLVSKPELVHNGKAGGFIPLPGGFRAPTIHELVDIYNAAGEMSPGMFFMLFPSSSRAFCSSTKGFHDNTKFMAVNFQTGNIVEISRGSDCMYIPVIRHDQASSDNIFGLERRVVSVGIKRGPILTEEFGLIGSEDGQYIHVQEDSTDKVFDLSSGGIFKITATYGGSSSSTYFIHPIEFYRHKMVMINAFSDIDNSMALSKKISTFSFLEKMLDKSLEIGCIEDAKLIYRQMLRMARFGHSNINQTGNRFIFSYGLQSY